MAGLIALLACAVLCGTGCTRSHRERNAGVPATVSVRHPTAAEIERAAREHRMPTDAELERVPIPSTPKLDVTGPTAPLDLEEARPPDPGPASRVRARRERHHAAPADLRDAGDARGVALRPHRRGGACECRCWCCAAPRTDPYARRWRRHASSSARKPVAWQIDPPAFARYRITAAPTFVLTRTGAVPAACADDVCLADHDFAKVTGDVSLDYALEAIVRGAPTFAADAEGYRYGSYAVDHEDDGSPSWDWCAPRTPGARRTTKACRPGAPPIRRSARSSAPRAPRAWCRGTPPRRRRSAITGCPISLRPAAALIAQCRTAPPGDVRCQAITTARDSAANPHPPIAPTDPSVVAATAIANDPSSILGAITGAYSACGTQQRLVSPANLRSAELLRLLPPRAEPALPEDPHRARRLELPGRSKWTECDVQSGDGRERLHLHRDHHARRLHLPRRLRPLRRGHRRESVPRASQSDEHDSGHLGHRHRDPRTAGDPHRNRSLGQRLQRLGSARAARLAAARTARRCRPVPRPSGRACSTSVNGPPVCVRTRCPRPGASTART